MIYELAHLSQRRLHIHKYDRLIDKGDFIFIYGDVGKKDVAVIELVRVACGFAFEKQWTPTMNIISRVTETIT